MSQLVQRLRQALGGDRAWSSEAACDAAEAIAALQVHLKHHFMVEEAGGYLEQVLEVAPRFSDRVAKLLAEHPRLLAQVADVAASATSAVNGASAWIVLKTQVNDLLGNLVAHEAAENRIVQKALNSGVEVE